MAGQLVSILVSDSWIKEAAAMLQDTTSLWMTNQHTNSIPVSKENIESPDGSDGLHLEHLGAGSVVKFVGRRYFEEASRWRDLRNCRDPFQDHC